MFTNLIESCLGSTLLHSRRTFPLAAETVLRSTYMDDSMDSVANEDQVLELHRQLSQLLAQAGMHARKWLSNSPRVLRAFHYKISRLK